MERLDELLLEWEDRRAGGAPVTPEALCPDDTGLRTVLAERVRLLEDFHRRFLASEAECWGPGPEPVPERIGKYAIRKRLGGGGMGVVFLGHDADLDRLVAVKIIRPEKFAFAATKLKDRFLREGQVLARLEHPNVVMVYESGWHGESPYLAMEYVPGGSLSEARDRLARGGPLAVVEKVARAVGSAHGHEVPVFHRDLKPANILLTTAGEPKVADFGLAKWLDGEPLGAEGAGAIAPTGRTTAGVGTPAYMAPEQADPTLGPITAATDVWALGVILYELLTGEHPTPGVRPDPAGVAKAVPGRLGRHLSGIVGRCLRPRPVERYPSADEVAEVLRRAQGLSRRTMIRRAVCAGGALLAAGVPVGMIARDPYQQFRLKTRGRVRAVREGQTIDLVEPGGTVPNYYVRAGAATTRVGMTAEGLVVQSSSLGVVELLPELPEAGCRIELELRHDFSRFKPGDDGCLGLFFTAARADQGKFTHHFFGYTMFDEFARRPFLALATAWYTEPAPGADEVSRSPSTFRPEKCGDFVAPAAAGTRPFRSLRYTISPDRALVTWEGQPPLALGPLRAGDAAGQLDEIDHEQAGLGAALAADYKPRIGVFVAGGKMTVRKLRITP